LFAAVLWLEGTLLGSLATSVAVVCVAGVGYAALTGRLPVRRALTTIAGCFVLFGAPAIANGLRSLTVREQVSPFAEPAPESPLRTPPVQEPSRPAPDPFDPYSG